MTEIAVDGNFVLLLALPVFGALITIGIWVIGQAILKAVRSVM